MDREKELDPNESTPEPADRDDSSTPRDDDAPNPRRTTTGKFTAPKFGNAVSGGFELEPGPERD